MALPEINGIGFLQQPNYPIINGIGIEKQPSLPVINGIDIAFEPYKKYLIFVDGIITILQMDGLVAITDKGIALNLNPINKFNLFYSKL